MISHVSDIPCGETWLCHHETPDGVKARLRGSLRDIQRRSSALIEHPLQARTSIWKSDKNNYWKLYQIQPISVVSTEIVEPKSMDRLTNAQLRCLGGQSVRSAPNSILKYANWYLYLPKWTSILHLYA